MKASSEHTEWLIIDKPNERQKNFFFKEQEKRKRKKN